MKKRTTASPPPAPPAEPLKPALVAGPGGPVKKKGRAGRKKERMQISVRIDQALMDLAYREIERRVKDKIRITDLLERGLLLALREIGATDPVASQARLLLNDAGVNFQRRIVRFHKLDVLFSQIPLSAVESKYRDAVLTGVDSVDEWPANALLPGPSAAAVEA